MKHKIVNNLNSNFIFGLQVLGRHYFQTKKIVATIEWVTYLMKNVLKMVVGGKPGLLLRKFLDCMTSILSCLKLKFNCVRAVAFCFCLFSTVNRVI